MASRSWSSSFLDWGKVDSDTGKKSLPKILVYNTCVESYRW